MIAFTIEGVPVAKGRPRFRIIGKGQNAQVQTYTPPETAAAEFAFRMEARSFKPRCPIGGPLRVDLIFTVPAPARLDVTRSRRWPHVKPDVDNYAKLVLDALNKDFWYDDAQVCACTITKVYGSPARTEVRIQSLGEADETQATLWGGITS